MRRHHQTWRKWERGGGGGRADAVQGGVDQRAAWRVGYLRMSAGATCWPRLGERSGGDMARDEYRLPSGGEETDRRGPPEERHQPLVLRRLLCRDARTRPPRRPLRPRLE